MKRKIAILFHEKARGQPLNYLINHYAEFWREDGHEVLLLFGVSQFVPADLVIVHVDLSVVPDEYLKFAQRYPIVLNGEVKDIRKSTFSRLLLKPGDPYTGQVIVKSNFNYAAAPERTLEVALDPRGFSASFFGTPLDYQIFENLQAVPSVLFADPNIIVEKFLPELENGLYCMRMLHFLGDRITCVRRGSRNPIVNGSTQVHRELVEPHPEILRLRKAMKFEFGKFDYVVHEGQALLLDANKTVGMPNRADSPERMAEHRYRADGLYALFDRTR